MMMNARLSFKNGSSVEVIECAENTRGERSNYIWCNCYELETNHCVFKRIDLREPIDRFIPECLF